MIDHSCNAAAQNAGNDVANMASGLAKTRGKVREGKLVGVHHGLLGCWDAVEIVDCGTSW